MIQMVVVVVQPNGKTREKAGFGPSGKNDDNLTTGFPTSVKTSSNWHRLQ